MKKMFRACAFAVATAIALMGIPIASAADGDSGLTEPSNNDYAREMCEYRKLYGDDGELYFDAMPQSAPWDFQTVDSSTSSFVPEGKKAVYMPYATHKYSYITIGLKNGQEKLDLEAVKRTGELRFKLYIETEDYDAKRDRIYVYLKNDASNSWKTTNSVYLSEDIVPNKWNDISIPLEYFGCYDTFDYENATFACLKRVGASDSKFNLYITDYEFYAPEGISLSVREKNGQINMKWWSGTKVSKFRCYRDGVMIKALSSSVTEYTYASPDSEKHRYSVEGYSGSAVAAESPQLLPDIDVDIQNEYDRLVFFEERLSAYADKAVIMRVGSTDGIAGNRRTALDYESPEVMPYKIDDRIFVPVKYSAEGIGASANVSADGSLCVNTAGSEHLFREGENNIERRNGVLFAETETLAEQLGTNIKIYNDLVILSADSSIAEMPDSVAAELGERLAYNRQSAYLGSLGYICDVISHPNNPQLLYCRTDVGGIYRYDRENKSWIQLMNSIPDEYCPVQAVRSVALDPNNDSVIYVSGGGANYSYPRYMIKSIDGGKTWQRLDFPGCTSADGEVRLMGNNIAVDPNDSGTVFAGSYSEGLFVSHNAGETWTAVGDIPVVSGSAIAGGISCVVIDGGKQLPDGRSAEVYVGVLGAGVYKSEDGGESFALIEGSPLFPCRFQLAGNRLFISATSNRANTIPGGFFCYENGTLTDLSPGKTDSEKHYMAFTVDNDDTDKIIVVKAPYRDADTIYRTFDGGESWAELGTIRNPSCIWQDPIDKGGLWWPHGAGMYYIKNKDAQILVYEDNDRGIEELCCTAVVSAPNGYLHTMVMDHGHMLSSNVNVKAKGVSPYYAKGAAVDYCEENPSFMLRVGYTNNDLMNTSAISVSTDGGASFTAVAWPEENRLIDAAVSASLQSNGKPTLIIAAIGDENGVGKGLWRSDDFGESWEKCADIVTKSGSWDYGCRLLASDRVNGEVFYWFDNEHLYCSKDSGNSWTEVKRFEKIRTTVTGDYDGEYIKTVPGSEGGIWIRRPDGIYTSYDFGDTWSIIKADKVKAFGFGAGKTTGTPTAYLYGMLNGESGFYISDDLGTNWSLLADASNGAAGSVTDICGDSKLYGRVYAATGGKGVICYTPVGTDDRQPSVTLDDSFSADKYNFTLRGSISEYANVWVNGEKTEVDGYNRFEYKTRLSERLNRFEVYSEDADGNRSETASVIIRYLPELKRVFYNSLDLEQSGMMTYVNVGKWDPEANKRMSIVGNDEMPDILDDGEYAAKMSFLGLEGYQLNRTQQSYIDVSDIADTGELRFKAYLSVDSGLDVTNGKSIRVRLTNDHANGWAASTAVSLPAELTANGGWYDVSIPISEFADGKLDLSKIYGLTFTAGITAKEKLRLYVKDVYFAEPIPFSRTVIREEDGTEAEEVQPGKAYYTEVSCDNRSKSDLEPVFITALYDGDVLVKTDSVESEMILRNEKYLYKSTLFSVPDSVSNPRIKVFVWDSDMMPFEKAE